MSKEHTKEYLEAEWKNVSQCPADLLYHDGKDLFNYKGKLKNDPAKMLCIEYVSKLAVEDFHVLEQIGGNPVGLRYLKSFDTKKHDGTSTASRKLKEGEKIQFKERRFALALFNSDYTFSFGKLFDYELPMKENKESEIGEIDLLSFRDNEIYVIELKIGQSESGKKNGETLLRAIMEAFTFVKLLNKRKDKFIQDMRHKFIADAEHSKEIQFRPAILTLTNARCGDHIRKLKNGGLPELKLLINKMNHHLAGLGILPFKFFAIDAENPELKIGDKSRIVFRDKNFTGSKVIE